MRDEKWKWKSPPQLKRLALAVGVSAALVGAALAGDFVNGKGGRLVNAGLVQGGRFSASSEGNTLVGRAVSPALDVGVTTTGEVVRGSFLLIHRNATPQKYWMLYQ